MPGLRVPDFAPMPFDIFFLQVDQHAIVHIDGHPDYEAVEAMINHGPNGPVARAVITLRDQRQVAHINDSALNAIEALTGRESYLEAIDVQERAEFGAPRVSIGFRSWRGEDILLDCPVMAEPSVAEGGLIDPGGHGAKKWLPLTYAARRATAREGACVAIDSVRYDAQIGAKFFLGVTGYNGFIAEDLTTVVLKAGARRYRLLRQPQDFAIGECWEYERLSEDGHKRILFAIVARAADLMIIEADRGTHREIVRVMFENGAMRLREIAITPPGAVTPVFRMRFAEEKFEAHFLKSGQILSGLAQSDGATLRFAPLHPKWAAARAMRTEILRDGEVIELKSVVAPSA